MSKHKKKASKGQEDYRMAMCYRCGEYFPYGEGKDLFCERCHSDTQQTCTCKRKHEGARCSECNGKCHPESENAKARAD